MTLPAPDWLMRHGGAVKVGPDHATWFVLFDGEPHYSLNSIPAAGKHGCALRQTENGRRLEFPTTYETAEAALHGGLEVLGKELGWV